MNFKNYYKFPLKKERGYRNVYTVEHHLAFQFPYINDTNHFVLSDHDQEIVTKVINGDGKLSHFYAGHFEYNKGNILLEGKVFIIVRGWGMLTGVGAYKLPFDDAGEIQDEFGQYITEKLNQK